MSRILRCLVCFLLICCILVNCSPLRADATAAGAAAAITGAASVAVPALYVVGATLIALGLHAGVNGTDGLEAVVDSAVTHLQSAGQYVVDGAVELLRTVDSAGTASYYVDGGIMESLRSWVYDSSVISVRMPDCSAMTDFQYRNYETAVSNYAYVLTWFDSAGNLHFVADKYYCPSVSWIESYSCWEISDGNYVQGGTFEYWYLTSAGGHSVIANKKRITTDVYPMRVGYSDEREITTNYDLTLGHLPSQDTTLDDTTVVTFHPYLADVQRFKRSGGSGDSGDGDDKTKWYLRLALGATTAAVMATTQQQQIENPSVDIEEITWGVQFDVTETTDPDDENKKVHLLTPQIGTGTDPGTGTNPDTGDGSGDNTGSDTGTDTGNSGNTGSSWKPPSDHSQFALTDLSKFFPFCIPFDLFDFFTLLNADPVAPSFSWQIQDLSGQTYALTVDLSQWDSVAQLFRRLQLFLFVCGLAAASRKYIKW